MSANTLYEPFHVQIQHPAEPPVSPETAVEISILSENGQGVEVQNLQSYGIGIDCHSRFIAVCVHVRRDSRVFRYQHVFDSDRNSLIEAKNWAVRTIRENSNPIPDLDQPLHYVIEATSTYHMPILLSGEGKPSVINQSPPGRCNQN